jgi:hypothetical protein
MEALFTFKGSDIIVNLSLQTLQDCVLFVELLVLFLFLLVSWRSQHEVHSLRLWAEEHLVEVLNKLVPCYFHECINIFALPFELVFVRCYLVPVASVLFGKTKILLLEFDEHSQLLHFEVFLRDRIYFFSHLKQKVVDAMCLVLT